jgi:hypothetical protein
MNEPLLTSAQSFAALALLLLICVVAVAEWFERAIQEDLDEHDDYRPDQEIERGE